MSGSAAGAQPHIHAELLRQSRPAVIASAFLQASQTPRVKRAHADATNCRISTCAAPPGGGARRRVGARAAGFVTCVALALAGQASVAAAKPWFRETDVATNTPSLAGCGKASHKARDIGGEAAAVFDVNGDRIPDIVIVNGTDYYLVALGHRNPMGGGKTHIY